MEDKIMFKVRKKDFYDGTFKLSVLKKFSENTGCPVLIEKIGIIYDGIFESFCDEDMLCKTTCNENTSCQVQQPNIYLTIKDD